MTYYQFAIRQNKIYLNLFIMNYTGVANSIKNCPGWVLFYLWAHPHTLTKCINTIAAMIS